MQKHPKRHPEESSYETFLYIVCALLILAELPVIAWHYYTNLSGLAVVSVVGLLATGVTLVWATRMLVKRSSKLMLAVSGTVKLLLGSTMILNAGIVIFLMVGESQTERLSKVDQENRNSEIERRAKLSDQMRKNKNRKGADDVLKMDKPKSSSDVVGEKRARLEKYVAPGYLDYGIYVFPLLLAFLGSTGIAFTHKMTWQHEDLNHDGIADGQQKARYEDEFPSEIDLPGKSPRR